MLELELAFKSFWGFKLLLLSKYPSGFNPILVSIVRFKADKFVSFEESKFAIYRLEIDPFGKALICVLDNN